MHYYFYVFQIFITLRADGCVCVCARFATLELVQDQLCLNLVIHSPNLSVRTSQMMLVGLIRLI